MTCIVGIEHAGEVWMGGDSACTEGGTIRCVLGPKVFVVGGRVLIGWIGSFRLGQLLQYELVVPEQECEDDMVFLVTRFIPAIRELLTQEVEKGGRFLVGYKGNLYIADRDFTILRLWDGYDAIGSAAKYALGVLWAVGHKWTPEEKIYRALEAAAYFSSGVCSPFHIERLVAQGANPDSAQGGSGFIGYPSRAWSEAMERGTEMAATKG